MIPPGGYPNRALQPQQTDRDHGTVKAYFADRGFGFIKSDIRGPDVFVHVKAIDLAPGDALKVGDRVSYLLDIAADNRVRAMDVRLERRADA